MGDKSPKDKNKKQAQRDAASNQQKKTRDAKQRSYDNSVAKPK